MQTGLLLEPVPGVSPSAILGALLLFGAPTADDAARTSTKSMTLSDLVQRALDHNRQINIDATRINEARALSSLAAAQAYPVIQATALFGGPTPEARTEVVNDLSTITEESLDGDFNFGGFGVTFRAEGTLIQPLYTFGQISSAKDAAHGLVRAAGHRVDITRAEVILNVHRAFWAYQLVRSFSRSLTEGEEILVRVLDKVEQLIEIDSPQVTENDRLRMTHGLATLRVRLVDAKNAEIIARKAICLLIDVDLETPLDIVTMEVEDIPENMPTLTKSANDAKGRRPELRALDALIDAQREWASFNARRFFPTLFLGGGANYAVTTNATDQTNPFIFDRRNFFELGIGLGLRFELDIWTKLADLEMAEAQLATRTAEADAAGQAIDLEVRKVHQELTGSYKRLEHLTRAYRAARGWLTSAVLAYDIGTGQARELIDAFLARATAEGELKKTYFDIQVRHAELARARGTLVRTE